MRSGTIGRLATILLWLLVLAAPTAVFALEDHGGHKGETTHVVYQEGDEEASGSTQEGSDGGVSFVLTLIAVLIGLIIAVVAILGAVSLGIIGIGYASVNSGES